jgi:pimeloyl-ACP methyl ester carboxylesterase
MFAAEVNKATRLHARAASNSDSHDDLVDYRVASPRRCVGVARAVRRCESVHPPKLQKTVVFSAYGAGMTRHTTAILQATPRDALLAAVSMPTLVMHGADDMLFPVAAGTRTAKCVRRSRFVVLKDTGHIFTPTATDEVVREIASVAKRACIQPVVN